MGRIRFGLEAIFGCRAGGVPRRAASCGAWLVLLLTLFPLGVRAQSAQELLHSADAALQKNDYAAAATALEAYLPLNPDDYRAKFNLALCYSMTDRKPQAITLYQALLAGHGDLLPARLNLGLLLLDAGNAQAALEQFDEVLAKEPAHWTAQVNRAAALAALNRLPEAREAYEQALRLKPDDARTHLAYAKLLPPEQNAAAEEHFRRALALDPSLDEARLSLAALLEDRAGHDAAAASNPANAAALEEAAQLYQKLLDAHPERVELHLHLANIFLAESRGAEAIRELEAARAAGANSYALNKTLLQTYLAAKEYDRALALIPEVLAQNDKDPELYLLLGTLRMQRKQYDLAALAFQQASLLDPQSAEAYKNLASAQYLLQNYPATLEALGRLAALRKDTAGTYFLRAITLDRLEQKAAALENYQRFLSAGEQRYPDQEFQARQRVIALQRELKQKH